MKSFLSKIVRLVSIEVSWSLSIVLAFILLNLTSCGDRKSQPAPKVTPFQPDFIDVPQTNSAATSSTGESTNSSASGPGNAKIAEVVRIDAQGDHDAALQVVNSIIQDNPNLAAAYNTRGQIYTEMKLWAKAQEDYEKSLQLDDKSPITRFNLAELKFILKDYDGARPGFLNLNKSDNANLADLASYKVFLCDLLGGHEDAARGELDAFNQVGANASYYFANIAWFLVHKQPEEARSWVASAERIYPPQKLYLFSSSLKALGYLPLPPPAAK